MCQDFGLEVKDHVAAGVAFGFGGGMGNSGSVCGAVIGAVMAIGLKSGRGATRREGLAKYGVVREFLSRFEAEMGSASCRVLIGLDLSTQDGMVKFMGSDTPSKVCMPAVATAYRLAVDLLASAQTVDQA